MKWVRDRTRRFAWRPYYAQHEIDTACEDIVSRFLSPNPPKDTDGRREESGRGVRELQGK